MNGGYYLLDTNVLLHWLRGSSVCGTIDGQFGLTASAFRPLVCEVTLGEIEAFAMSSKWGEAKRQKLSEVRRKLVVVDLTDARIYRSFAEYSTLAKERGFAIFHDKNDLWIAAAAKVSGATVLTTDAKGFKPLRDGQHLDVVVLDPQTGWAIP
ncbi:MAG: type II toxin-antitoxin system VapC family toxin [Verrucomicrobia bacterium]|nr:type II toxin-antitoxin system VapC family toxin [Verrucomicrobiota bacterium]